MNKYFTTALNLSIGPWYFKERIAAKHLGKRDFLILSFDPDEISDMEAMPKLLDDLQKHDMKASFAIIGAWAEQYTKIWKRVIQEGHELINHTQTHPDNIHLNPHNYHKISRKEREKEIKDCHETVKRVLSYEMIGFRTPHFGFQHTQDTYEILEKIGYKFSTSTLAIDTENGEPYKQGDIIEFPLSYCPKHPWSIYDSAHAFRGKFCNHSAEDFLEQFEKLIESGVYLNIYLDPQDLHKFDFQKMLKIIQKKQLETKVYGELLA